MCAYLGWERATHTPSPFIFGLFCFRISGSYIETLLMHRCALTNYNPAGCKNTGRDFPGYSFSHFPFCFSFLVIKKLIIPELMGMLLNLKLKNWSMHFTVGCNCDCRPRSCVIWSCHSLSFSLSLSSCSAVLLMFRFGFLETFPLCAPLHRPLELTEKINLWFIESICCSLSLDRPPPPFLFLQEVRAYYSPDSKCIIAHCFPGISLL